MSRECRTQEARTPFSLLAPPYREFLPLDPTESFPADPAVVRGVALVWELTEGLDDELLRRVAARPGGLALMVVLPPAERIRRLRRRVWEVTEDARPQTVLPHHPRLIAEEMAGLLRQGPSNLSYEVVDYVQWRGLELDQETRRLIRRTVELSAELRTLKALARGLYLSRRALGRRFKRRKLPVPSHWLQFCRLLRAVIRLQNSRSSLFGVACSLGYADGFTLSNQMERLVGVRPSLARERLGWEWFLEAWLQCEHKAGGLALSLRRPTGTPCREGEPMPVSPPV